MDSGSQAAPGRNEHSAAAVAAAASNRSSSAADCGWPRGRRRVPIYVRRSCVERATRTLIRKHVSPTAALEALQPALVRLHEVRFAVPATPGDWSARGRAYVRHAFWLDVRIELRELDRLERRPFCRLCHDVLSSRCNVG
jgi:hypothetical protein